MPSRSLTLDKLPLFASDADIGLALLGPKRACEWKAIAELLESKGLPKIDTMMGGRYVPGIRAFFDRSNGLNTMPAPPTAPDGSERPDAWTAARQRRG